MTIRRRQVVNLDDGSVAIAEPIPSTGAAASVIRRWVRGELVWEQTYSAFPDAHDAQVARVLAAMVARPADFAPHYLRPLAEQIELGAA